MKGYKEPGFQDRAAASARAKTSALKQMKDAPKPDAAELAAGAARQQERDAKAAAKREEAAAKRAEKEEARAREREIKAEAKREREKPAAPPKSEAELKAARDARYAARKKRKS